MAVHLLRPGRGEEAKPPRREAGAVESSPSPDTPVRPDTRHVLPPRVQDDRSPIVTSSHD